MRRKKYEILKWISPLPQKLFSFQKKITLTLALWRFIDFLTISLKCGVPKMSALNAVVRQINTAFLRRCLSTFLWTIYLIRICNYHSEDICKDEDIAENKIKQESFTSAPIRERNYSLRKKENNIYFTLKSLWIFQVAVIRR